MVRLMYSLPKVENGKDESVLPRTGYQRLFAYLSRLWSSGKALWTAGRLGDSNNVGVVWTAQGRPLLSAADLTESEADDARHDAVHAEIGRVIAQLMD